MHKSTHVFTISVISYEPEKSPYKIARYHLHLSIAWQVPYFQNPIPMTTHVYICSTETNFQQNSTIKIFEISVICKNLVTGWPSVEALCERGKTSPTILFRVSDDLPVVIFPFSDVVIATSTIKLNIFLSF